MNIVYVNWNCFGSDDLVHVLYDMGHNIYVTQLSEKCRIDNDEEFTAKLEGIIKEQKTDLVLTFNYYPSISIACQNTGCRYFAWIYDSPYTKLYDKTINNEVNYIGIFDSYMVNELNAMGVDTVHYVPLAVNCKRLEEQIRKSSFKADDISFVGTFYDSPTNFYDRLLKNINNNFVAGYLDGITDSQRLIYGYNFLEESITDDLLELIRNVMPYDVSDRVYISEKRVYADYYLSPRVARCEREGLVKTLSRYFNVGYYSNCEKKELSGAAYRGIVNYYTEMPLVFHNSKININSTLKSIRTGIPLRAMDILGAGGFLLTNYQEDMFRHFEPEKHFTYYSSVEEAVDKADFYLRNEDKRQAIVKNAYELMLAEHTYEKRFDEVFKDMGLIK